MLQKLPPSLVWIFETYGFGELFGGLFKFCEPDRFRSILALIFKADPDFSHRDCHIIGFTAFGELRVWSERHGPVDIDLPACRVGCSALAPTKFITLDSAPQTDTLPTDDSMARAMIPFDQEDVDYQDFAGRPMYRRCVKTHGALTSEECFGFFPALAVSGEGSRFQSVDKIKRVTAIEHFALLAQLAPFTLTKVGPRGFEHIRAIG